MSGIDAQVVVELLDTQAFFELLKLPYPGSRTGVIDRLTRERLVTPGAGSRKAPASTGRAVLL
jgi:hypothetical protein